MKNLKLIAISLFFALFTFVQPNSSQADNSDFTISVPTMKFIMAFHGCNTNCADARNHQVFLAQSDNGTDFSLLQGWKPFYGSVPATFRRGNTIYIYTAGGDVRKVNMDTGVVHYAGKAKIFVDDTEDKNGFVDPSIIQQNDGRFVLFYLPGSNQGDPAGCGGATSCTKEIKFAIEKPGSDGMKFVYKSVAFSKNLTGNETLSDPDIYIDGSKWTLMVSEGPSVEVLTADTLIGDYTLSGVISKNNGGVPAGIHDTTSNQNWIYTSKDDSAGNSIIRRSVTSSGISTLTSFVDVITSNIYTAQKMTTIASPSIRFNTVGKACDSCTSSSNTNESAASPSPSSVPQSASPSPSVSSSKVMSSEIKASPKSLTITCIKGKLIKKVIGVNPKCPTGYKIK